MVLMTTASGLMVSTHESFTHPFANTGVEVHGTHGSLINRTTMSAAYWRN